MTTNEVITLARKHLGKGSMESSARLCLAEAIKLSDTANETGESGFLIHARERAIKSLAYSVGILHPDYRQATAGVDIGR